MTLHVGDCLDVLRTLPDCTVDAVVTDPPAGIAFMGKAWDGNRGGRDQWVAWLAERLAECLRVLKPGGHAVVWALPRTSGWTHRALEDAGFEVRDCITHLFGSGFPKSLDVGKAIDKAAGCERDIPRSFRIGDGAGFDPKHRLTGALTATDICERCERSRGSQRGNCQCDTRGVAATEQAREWDGWGTALKPAAEFWYLARKPLDTTVAANVCRWGTGALNIDATRVGGSWSHPGGKKSGRSGGVMGAPAERGASDCHPQGRWPANVALTHPTDCGGDGCAVGCPVAELDRQSGELHTQDPRTRRAGQRSGGTFGLVENHTPPAYWDHGGASRFFPTFRYQAKPSTREKNTGVDDRNTHPTVKPVELMRWLCRLVTPPGGTVLDPFAGSGTTLVAATLEGFDTVGVEHEADYLPIIEGRVRWAEDQCEQTQLPLTGG